MRLGIRLNSMPSPLARPAGFCMAGARGPLVAVSPSEEAFFWLPLAAKPTGRAHAPANLMSRLGRPTEALQIWEYSAGCALQVAKYWQSGCEVRSKPLKLLDRLDQHTPARRTSWRSDHDPQHSPPSGPYSSTHVARSLVKSANR